MSTIIGASVINGVLVLERSDGTEEEVGNITVAPDPDYVGGGGGLSSGQVEVIADEAISEHVADTDPHGDRAYTDAAISNIENGAGAAVDTLKELGDLISTDTSGLAALTSVVGTKETPAGAQAKVDALSSTVTTALGTKETPAGAQAKVDTLSSTITTALGTKETPAGAQAKVDTHVNNDTGAHAGSAVSIAPSGLAIVTGTTVQSAIAQLDAATALKAPLASPTFTGVLTTPIAAISGITGGVQTSRFAGATASGAPTAGAHLQYDMVASLDGVWWICTVSGTPGTWIRMGARNIQLDRVSSTASITSISTSKVDIISAITFTVTDRPVEVHLFTPWTGHTTSTKGTSIYITSDTGVNSGVARANANAGMYAAAANAYLSLQVFETITTPGTYTLKGMADATASGGFVNTGGLGKIFIEAVEH